jgi:hypothetical protein
VSCIANRRCPGSGSPHGFALHTLLPAIVLLFVERTAKEVRWPHKEIVRFPFYVLQQHPHPFGGDSALSLMRMSVQDMAGALNREDADRQMA